MTDESIFTTALDITDLMRRSAYLEAACADDPGRRARVEQLLAAYGKAGDFLERPAAAPEHPNAVTRTFGADTDGDSVTDARAFLLPSPRPGALGRVGHYDVLEVLGRGGFGIVFRAFDDTLQRVVAVKVLSPQMAATSPARKRFLREARSSAAIRHENVVQVHAVSRDDESLPYLVMEFIPGETLQQKLDRTGPLAVAEVVRIGRQIAEGLAAAHATGLIHRDVKPANVLIEAGPHERAKLTDFGLARAADDASISQSGIVAGTPLYMSPEQAKGDTLDHRSDLFSLGSVLYVMCTGRPPFRASGTLAVLKRVCEEQPRPIREVIPEVPKWLCQIVEKLHAKNPADRFQTAREVADLLADCEKQLQAHGALKNAARIPESKAEPVRRARPWMAVAALLVLALAVVGSAAVIYSLNRAPGKGTFLLTRDDPEMFFTLEGQGITHSFYANDSALNSAEPIELPAGEYVLRGFRDKQQVFVDSFKLAPGENKLVRIPSSKPKPPAVPSPSADGWMQLFNGKDLTGWRPHPEEGGKWVVENGALTCTGPHGYLFSERDDYENFHLRAEIRINGGGDSGVFVRSRPDPLVWYTGTWHPNPAGYEAQIAHRPPNHTGSLWLFTSGWNRSLAPAAPDRSSGPVADKLFTLEIVATGSQLHVFVNGTKTADVLDSTYHRGHIALQHLGDRTAVRFRKIEIRELPAAAGSDKHRLQGAWLAESAEALGAPLPADQVRQMRLEFTDGGVRIWQPGKPVQEGAFKLDPAAAPKEIDAIRSAAVTRGIYRFDGDRLTLCMGEPGPDRPREFRTGPDTGPLVLGTLRRAPAPQELAVVPFGAPKAAEYQAAWAAHLGMKAEFTDKKLGVAFRVIPPGDFQMGAKDEEVNPDILRGQQNKPPGWQYLVRSVKAETPRHPVRITRPFAIGKYEVTVGQFRQFVAATGYKTVAEQKGGYGIESGKVVKGEKYNWKNVGYEQADLAPVWNVTRDDAVEFCKWLSKEDGRTFRLPTEAEWEWACRAGTDTRTFWREGESSQFAVKPGPKTKHVTKPVGQLKPNAFGLYDTCGNVWEWCNDWFSESYYKNAPAADPTGPTEPQGGVMARHRVQRGGGVDGGQFGLCSTARSLHEQEMCGFRVVCEIAGDAKLPPPEIKKPADPALAERRKEVAARGQARDDAKQRVDAGAASKLDLLAAEVALTEARNKLAEAEKNPEAAADLLEDLVAFRQEERDLIAARVKEGIDARTALDAADARLADAKARLVKVRPPEELPEPRPKP
jgi:uncharacterized protein (TIGR03067 family)